MQQSQIYLHAQAFLDDHRFLGIHAIWIASADVRVILLSMHAIQSATGAMAITVIHLSGCSAPRHIVFVPCLPSVRSLFSGCMAGAGMEIAGCLRTTDFGGPGVPVADGDFLLGNSAYVT